MIAVIILLNLPHHVKLLFHEFGFFLVYLGWGLVMIASLWAMWTENKDRAKRRG